MSTELPLGGSTPTGTHRARRSGLWAGAALLLAVAALLACAWLLTELRRVSDRAGALAQELQRAQIRIEATAEEAGQLRAQSHELADRNASVGHRLEQTRAALERAAQAQGNVDFALAEVEHLLILAQQHLVLMQDVETAQAALQAVERRLEGLQAPGLDAVRGQVAADLLRLAQVPKVDYNQWIEDLGELAAAVEMMPLRPETQAAVEKPATATSPAPQGWRGFLHAVWQELRGMVVIMRAASGPAPLPGERYYLVQNLLLQIETTRLALLRRDTRALHAAADSGARWLQRWFDGSDPRVRNALEQMQTLATLHPAPQLPDITSSMETLRALVRERAAPAPLAPTPAPAP